jgi:hypothetical protein
MAELKDVRNDYHGVTNLTSDIDNTETNIALLAFKVAAGDSLIKFEMVDQVIDDYVDDSGIDTITSLQEIRSIGGNYYSSGGAGTETLLIQGGTAPTGIADSMVSVSGFSNWSVSTLNDSSTGGSGLLADGVPAGSYIHLDLGSGNGKNITKCGIFYQNTNIRCLFSKVEWSTDNSSWTTINFTTNIGGSPNTVAGHNYSNSFTGPGEKRYWRLVKTDPAVSGSWMSSMSWFYTPNVVGTALTLVSTATTAETTDPTTGDIVMLLEDGLGTALLNTDIKAHISRDDGATWTETTLTNEGTWGTNKKILVARDVDISSQPSGQSMKYKIETFGQAGSAPHTITVTSNTHTDTSVKKFGTASAQFAGGTDALTTSSSSDFSITGDFTIDCWCYFSSINTPIASSLSNEDWGLASTGDWIWIVDGNGWISFQVKGVGSTGSTVAHPTLNEWNHFAVERSGGTTTMYKNGTSIGSNTGPGTGTIGNSGNTLTVGGRAIALVGGYNGYTDEFRFSKGIARYGADFTSPTAPYTIDVNTQLLLHMDGANGGTTFTGEHYARETRIHATSLAWK